jgi:hypothetical protein
VNAAKPILLALSLLCARNAPAQQVEKEPAAIVELGGATDWSITEGGSSFGPTIAVEVTPIENWLELEAGITPLFRHHSTEWDIDLLFKEPWTLSKKAEFMAGIGPEWVHATKYNVTRNSVSGEAVLDFMFWPSAKRRFGWYLERAMNTTLGEGMSNRLASVAVC